MKYVVKWAVVSAIVASVLGGFSGKAAQITVQEVGIGANETVSINSSTLGAGQLVYAGIVNLRVNGVPTQGFCIDPFHWSVNGPQSYELVALDLAPKSPGGPMDSTTAMQIEQLWAQYFSPNMGNELAAGLQIAIWTLIDRHATSASFSVNGYDYGAPALLQWLTGHPDAPTADLVALTGKAGQDYVIQNVPDGGATVILLGMGMLGLAVAGRQLRFC